MSNKATKQSNNRLFNNPKLMTYAKILSFTMIILSFSIIICSTLPRTFNDGFISIFINYPFVISWSLFWASIIMLDTAHGSAYWYKLDKKRIKLDERQLLVRNRIFERSYLVICTLAIFMAIIISGAEIQLTSPMILVPLAFVICSIPNIIASWQKDA